MALRICEREFDGACDGGGPSAPLPPTLPSEALQIETNDWSLLPVAARTASVDLLLQIPGEEAAIF